MAMQPTPEDDLEVENLVKHLKDLRVKKGISQREIAAEMGVAQPNFQRMEAGKYNPKIQTLQVWARALGYRMQFQLENVPVTLDAIDKILEEQLGAPVNGSYVL